MADQVSQQTQSIELYCPQCGYDLRAIESERCPECGLAIDRSKLGESIIPWIHRKRIGWWRAFWSTVWMSIRRPGEIARESVKPVSYRDVQRFRWNVVFIAAVPIVIWIIACQAIFKKEINAMAGDLFPQYGAWQQSQAPFVIDPILCWIRGATLWHFTPIFVVLLFAVCSGVASYFFHPGSIGIERQNRAVALSYYSCGPLAMLFLPAAGWGAVMMFDYWITPLSGMRPFNILIALGAVALYVATLGVPLAWWLSTIRMLRGSTLCSATRFFAATTLLPLIWILLFALCIGMLPAICGFLMLVIKSYSG